MRLSFLFLLPLCSLCLLTCHSLSGAKNGSNENASVKDNQPTAMVGSSKNTGKNRGKKARFSLPQYQLYGT